MDPASTLKVPMLTIKVKTTMGKCGILVLDSPCPGVKKGMAVGWGALSLPVEEIGSRQWLSRPPLSDPCCPLWLSSLFNISFPSCATIWTPWPNAPGYSLNLGLCTRSIFCPRHALFSGLWLDSYSSVGWVSIRNSADCMSQKIQMGETSAR